jgi:ketosteroid isomerase-like protein
MRRAIFLSMIFLSPVAAFAQSQPPPHHSATATRQQSDTQAIEQIEADFLAAEKQTDPAVIDRVLADDYVNLAPQGTGPGKANILKHFRVHAGQAPPYSVETKGMHIYILGDTAVAAYVKTYTAKENGNVAHEDTTHIFTRTNEVWKLRISRASIHPGE